MPIYPRIFVWSHLNGINILSENLYYPLFNKGFKLNAHPENKVKGPKKKSEIVSVDPQEYRGGIFNRCFCLHDA